MLDEIKDESELDPTSTSNKLKSKKGMIFVPLYSVIEYTLHNCATQFLTYLNGLDHPPREYRNELLCLMLNSGFASVAASKGPRVYSSRLSLIDSVYSDTSIPISNDCFPGDAMNVSLSVVKEVWKYFGLQENLSERLGNLYFDEIKENRNAVAHGRETSMNVGKRYTYTELEKRYSFVARFRDLSIESFNGAIAQELYLER
ncbi:HEPN domain-containing protein [Vreelandella piezotolerans]|uniref:HEPN domain-containing protein n=1 Tax=Vreelandella piezotolerans TaxID=2609667 RepID=UPI0037A5FC9D